MPDGQSEQVASMAEVAFGAPNLPAAHGVPEHEVAPAEAFVPGRHGVLSLVPPTQKCPAGHGAPAADDDPTAQYEPAEAEQGEHVALAATEKVPARQGCLSLEPPRQKEPAGHGVPEAEVDPSGQKKPALALHG